MSKLKLKSKNSIKAKIIVTATRIIELNPEFYPMGSKPEDMLKTEIDLADGDTITYLNNDDVAWKISGELVNHEYNVKMTRKP